MQLADGWRPETTDLGTDRYRARLATPTPTFVAERRRTMSLMTYPRVENAHIVPQTFLRNCRRR